VPAAPAPIDYNKMAEASIRVAQAQSAAEEAAIKRLYPEYIRMQFGTADQLSRNLDNQYSQFARQTILDEMGRDMGPSALENQMRALGASAMSYRPDQISAPTNIREVRSEAVGAGGLGNSLMGEAQRRVALQGRLSAEAERDATQTARAAMAARGMATGSAGAAAEVLNRDRFARARNSEDLAFASGVQSQDLQRRMNNASMGMDAQRLNQVRDTTLGQFLLNSQMANQEANMNQVNNNRGFLSSVSQQALANDQMRSQRRLGLGTLYGDMDPYRQALGPAFQLGMGTLGNTTQQVGNIFGNSLQQAGNVFSFNTNMAASNRNAILNNNASLQAAGMQAGAMNNAATMGMIGGIGSGLLQGAGMFALSDKREKKDIKPLGKAGSVLGLTAYEFSYKGDDKKRKGFMAQDVKKVLPEAVAEVDYKGKKRLAIKPAVIGAALAEELMAAKAA
jgi:hypothetical protein